MAGVGRIQARALLKGIGGNGNRSPHCRLQYQADGRAELLALDAKMQQPCVRARITKDFSYADVWAFEEKPASGRGWVSMKILNHFVEVCLRAQCFLPHWDRTTMGLTLAFSSDLTADIPCRRLAFAKQSGIADYVRNRVSGTARAVS